MVDKTKVLLLGFSVTADGEGYAPVVRRRLAASGLEVDVCGVGGVNPLPLASLFTHVNQQRGPFSHVVLEIATSIYGQKLTSPENEALDVLYDLLRTIQNTGAQISLVNLYRSSFDYQYHYFDMLLEALAARYELPLLDLANGLLQERGKEALSTMLRDLVHTNRLGAEFQGEAVTEFVRSLPSRAPNKVIPEPRYRRTAVLVADQQDMFKGLFTRSGLAIDYAEISEGQVQTIALSRKSLVYGISFLSGPRAGVMVLRGGGKELTIPAYDEHSFYERYNFQRWTPAPIECDELTITQLAGVPDIKLRKGNVDTGPRLGRVVAVHRMEATGRVSPDT